MTVELDLRPEVVDAYARAGRARVHETAAPSNVALARRKYGVWGYDPVVLRRYMEFMVWTQGMNWREIRKPTRFVPYKRHPLHAMLRVRTQIAWKTRERIDYSDGMARFVFVDDYEVAETDGVLDRMAAADFDPRRRVILESAPSPAPVPGAFDGARPRLRVISESTDHVDLEVEVEGARILVVTDAYSAGWRARPLAGSDQQSYELLPANYVLRAIPLAAGRHRLRLEYSPMAWRAGLAVSGLSTAAYVGVGIFWLHRRRSARPRSSV